VLVGLVRQSLLARTRDSRQFARLEDALAGFPDLPVLTARPPACSAPGPAAAWSQMTLSPWQALLWAIAERIGGLVWSQDRHWLALRAHGCPIA
jgi:hypothetical protein